MLIHEKGPFVRGSILLISFLVLFCVLLTPIMRDEKGNHLTGLQYADNVFNELSKGSSYFIPSVREHVKTLGDKAYWNAFADAPDFVIAFIPNESLLQAALETDPTLMDDAFARKVALTSPITLWAVLKSVAYAWQQQSLTDDAKMLFDLSRELYERFAVLGDRATKLGSAITKTVGAYNAFASSLESRVLVTARKLQRVDQSRIIEPVNMIAPEKADVRELTAPETSEQ